MNDKQTKDNCKDPDDHRISCVAYLGPEATYSHQAAVSMYGAEVILKSTETIEDVFILVERKECEQGVVPVENSYEGAVNITMDLLNKYQIKICAEFYLRIRHNMLSREKNMSDIKRIYSHPHAIAQCRLWLKNNLQGVSTCEVSSTSRAARLAADEQGAAAIGSSLAAETYGLNLLRENIEDDKDNVTRFLVIGNRCTGPTGIDKTSLLFFLKHEPGALYKCLAVLAERRVNMTRIESRPVKTKNWEYLFFVDLEGHEDEMNIRQALKEMEQHCVFMKRLGSYPRGAEPYRNIYDN